MNLVCRWYNPWHYIWLTDFNLLRLYDAAAAGRKSLAELSSVAWMTTTWRDVKSLLGCMLCKGRYAMVLAGKQDKTKKKMRTGKKGRQANADFMFRAETYSSQTHTAKVYVVSRISRTLAASHVRWLSERDWPTQGYGLWSVRRKATLHAARWNKILSRCTHGFTRTKRWLSIWIKAFTTRW